MADALVIKPVVSATAAVRRASSSCHGAKLNMGAGAGQWECRDCGQPCDRVLSAPEEVTASG